MADASIPAEAAAGLTPLEAACPLRDSLLWRLQTRFYETQGVRAWSDGVVPNFVTSNAFLAGLYARVILGFVRDWYR